MIFAYVAGEAHQFAETCRRVAARVNGAFLEGGFWSTPRVRFRLYGREAELEFYGGSKNSPPYSRVRVDVRGASPGFLKIVPDGLGRSFLKLFGAQDLRVGDPDFDRAFVVRATPPELASRIFAPERRRLAADTLWSLRRFSRPAVDLGRERLLVQVRRKLRREADIHALIDAAKAWVGFLAPEESGEGIAWVEASTAAEGDCQICGTRLESNVVACATCRTRHHRECWEYTGECSTYACRERRFV